LIFEQYQKRTVRQPYDVWMSTDRPNSTLSADVELALAMPDKRAAAGFLTGRGAGFALICRVLGDAGQRRAGTLDLPPSPG
jgi:hypothetical protein